MSPHLNKRNEIVGGEGERACGQAGASAWLDQGLIKNKQLSSRPIQVDTAPALRSLKIRFLTRRSLVSVR